MYSKRLREIIGHKIKVARTQLKLRQADVADKLDINFANISSWERGITIPAKKYINRLTEILDTNDSYFELSNKELIPDRIKIYTIDNIGEFIKILRLKTYLTQVDIANQVGVTKQCVSLWELNQLQVNKEKLISLLEVFNSNWNSYNKTFLFMFRDLVEGKKTEVKFADYEDYDKLSFEDYTVLAKRTMNYGLDHYAKIDNCLFGLAGETGEIIDMFKKKKYHGHKLTKEEIQDELGDLFWYIANLCDVLELDFDTILKQNIKKLSNRYPQGFSTHSSINRT